MGKGKTPRRAARSRSSDPKRRRKGDIEGEAETSRSECPRQLPPTPQRRQERRSRSDRDIANTRRSLLRPAAENLGFAAVTALGDLVQHCVDVFVPPPASDQPPRVPAVHSPSARLKSPGRASGGGTSQLMGDAVKHIEPGLARHAFLLGIRQQPGSLPQCQHDVSAIDMVKKVEFDSPDSPDLFCMPLLLPEQANCS